MISHKIFKYKPKDKKTEQPHNKWSLHEVSSGLKLLDDDADDKKSQHINRFNDSQFF